MKPCYQRSGISIYQGKVEKVPQLAGSFDAVLCDPPYHLTTGKRGGSGPASQNLKHPGGRARITTGFMGKAWDGGDVAFRPETWAEVLHVLEPGAPLMAFGGARTFHRLACAIEDGGFALSDTLCWLYGQGFPKGQSQLKPAWEPITLAWKKGKRVLAIDAGRIAGTGNKTFDRAPGDRDREQYRMGTTSGTAIPTAIGRWPANVLLDEESAAALDRQSGTLTRGEYPSTRNTDKFRGIYSPFRGAATESKRGENSGGASRFFYCAKASRSERGDGNTHPTVKPLKLLEYLARLILPPKGNRPCRLLVPFSGSGSEIIAARRAGWDEVVGIELNPEYVSMSIARLEAQKPQKARASAA